MTVGTLVNLSALLLAYMLLWSKVFIKGRWYAATEKVQKWYTESIWLGNLPYKNGPSALKRFPVQP